jgi:hypothetical protein
LLCALLPTLAATSCGPSKEVILKTSDGVELTAKDVDRNPLALLPGGSLGTFDVDAQALFRSPAGGRFLRIVNSRLPVPPSAGFVAERDLQRLSIGLYSFQGVDFMGVANGNFQPEAIERAARSQEVTQLGTPLVRVQYAGREFYVSGNLGFVVLTPHTALFGNETGIRRGLDRLEEGRIRVELAPSIESLLSTSEAPLAFGSDAEYDPQVAAIAEQLPFLKGMSLLRVVGNFDPPGINLAGTLTYKDVNLAEQGKASLLQFRQNIQTYGVVASLLGLSQPISKLDVVAVESSLQVSAALEAGATATLLDKLAAALGANP